MYLFQIIIPINQKVGEEKDLHYEIKIMINKAAKKVCVIGLNKIASLMNQLIYCINNVSKMYLLLIYHE